MPVSYTVSYFGERITRRSVTVDVTRATIDLPAVDSVVNVFVTAMNVFGSGGNSATLMDNISELTTYMHVHMFAKTGYTCMYVAFITCSYMYT